MNNLFCPYHGRTSVDELTFSCSCTNPCFRNHSAINDVINVLNKNRETPIQYSKDACDSKKLLNQIERCPKGSIIKIFCGTCKGREIGYLLKKIDFENQITTTFVGAPSTGKSNMIACLYESIKEYTTTNKTSLTIHPRMFKKDFDDTYLKPLFPPTNSNEKPRVITKTEKDAQELFILEIKAHKSFIDDDQYENILEKSEASKWHSVEFENHNIFFYDYAGEKLLDYNDVSKLHSVIVSNCIILLIDPASLNISEYFYVKNEKKLSSQYDNLDILNNILGNFPDKKLKKLIIVLSKADNFFRGCHYPNPFSKGNEELVKASEKVFEMYFDKPHKKIIIDEDENNERIIINYNWINKYSKVCEKFFRSIDKETSNLPQLIDEAKANAEEVFCFVVSSFGAVGVIEENEIQFLKGRPEMRHLDNLFYTIIKN